MKLKELPFKIGMQYENWEFDLELVSTKKSYEVYKYIKEDIEEINEELIEQIHLYFELDILFKVEIKTHYNLFTLL
ncbi:MULTISPECIES: hypothetical protein [Tenacibaculum]|nr:MULTISPECIES: hypothetical protein [Tenacibaculum]MCT4699175.1 hypothetical protein [Tenacibaculum haliotis]